MRPLSSLGAERARTLKGLLFDLDDTLLTRGVLTKTAFDALWGLHDGGLRLVAVTGRPSAWGELLVRQWPIDGAVTENGAVHVLREGRTIVVRERCTKDEREARTARLKALITEVAEAVPEAKLTDDVAGRRSDITWDIGEHQYLAMDRVDRIVAIILHAGARTTRSSVHVHATFDVDDKASGAISFLAGAFGEDAGSAVSRYAFIGDSGNDAACFGGFAVTFGVANVKASLRRIAVPPRYVASLSMGEGFAEVATTLLSLRAGAPSAPQRGVDELEVRANRA
jgi:HAD superfamily hydrolase (TIGR01484 family)